MADGRTWAPASPADSSCPAESASAQGALSAPGGVGMGSGSGWGRLADGVGSGSGKGTVGGNPGGSGVGAGWARLAEEVGTAARARLPDPRALVTLHAALEAEMKLPSSKAEVRGHININTNSILCIGIVDWYTITIVLVYSLRSLWRPPGHKTRQFLRLSETRGASDMIINVANLLWDLKHLPAIFIITDKDKEEDEECTGR